MTPRVLLQTNATAEVEYVIERWAQGMDVTHRLKLPSLPSLVPFPWAPQMAQFGTCR